MVQRNVIIAAKADLLHSMQGPGRHGLIRFIRVVNGLAIIEKVNIPYAGQNLSRPK
jgi:hypothetical protein